MADVFLDPWVEALDELPLLATGPARLRAMVCCAALAPSSHNAQPWRFRFAGDDTVELLADRGRALPVADPEDRELILGCGAALFHLRLAARMLGWTDLVTVLPRDGGPDLLARVRLGAERPPSEADRRLYRVVRRRHTNRGPFDRRPVPDSVLVGLAEAAAAEGGWLTVVREPARRLALAALVARGDRAQMADPAFRRELARWLRPNRSGAVDGIPGFALGEGDLAAMVGPLVVRTFDVGEGQAARDRDVALGSPVLAVLGAHADEPPGWLAAGQALARVLLLARADGVQASFLNQPVEVPVLRDRLRTLLGRPGAPQLVLRLGFAPDARPTPRRPPDDLILS